MAIITNASIYVGGAKYGEVTQANWEIDNGGEPKVADSGYLGHTAGNPTTKVSLTSIVPYGNVTVGDLAKAVMTGKLVDIIGGVIGNNIWTCKKMTVSKATIDSDSTKRTLDGKFEITGGLTEIT